MFGHFLLCNSVSDELQITVKRSNTSAENKTGTCLELKQEIS